MFVCTAVPLSISCVAGFFFISGRPLQVTVCPVLQDRYPFCPVCLSVTLVHCGQTVGWIKMPLDAEVGFGPGDIVLDGNHYFIRWEPSSPTETGTAALHFSPHFALARSPISATAELLLVFFVIFLLFYHAVDSAGCPLDFQSTLSILYRTVCVRYNVYCVLYRNVLFCWLCLKKP